MRYTLDVEIGKWAIRLMIVASFLVFTAVSLVNHELFLTFGWDLGFYDQIAWNLSRLRFPFSTFISAPAFGVRFSPILLLFAPFYRLFPDARILLVGQALLATLAAYPLYLLGKRVTRSSYVGIAAALSYLTFIGLERAVFFPSSIWSCPVWGTVGRRFTPSENLGKARIRRLHRLSPTLWRLP